MELDQPPPDRLAEWMGMSDVLCANMAEIAEQLDRIADITERQASDMFDHLEAVAALTGVEHLFAGATPRDDRDALLESHLQSMMAGLVRADYMRQAIGAMAAILRGCVGEVNGLAAETLGAAPHLQPSAQDVADRMRAIHMRVGLTALRERMLGRLGGLAVEAPPAGPVPHPVLEETC